MYELMKIAHSEYILSLKTSQLHSTIHTEDRDLIDRCTRDEHGEACDDIEEH